MHEEICLFHTYIHAIMCIYAASLFAEKFCDNIYSYEIKIIKSTDSKEKKHLICMNMQQKRSGVSGCLHLCTVCLRECLCTVFNRLGASVPMCSRLYCTSPMFVYYMYLVLAS